MTFLPYDTVRLTSSLADTDMTVIDHRGDNAVLCSWSLKGTFNLAAFDADHLKIVSRIGFYLH